MQNNPFCFWLLLCLRGTLHWTFLENKMNDNNDNNSNKNTKRQPNTKWNANGTDKFEIQLQFLYNVYMLRMPMHCIVYCNFVDWLGVIIAIGGPLFGFIIMVMHSRTTKYDMKFLIIMMMMIVMNTTIRLKFKHFLRLD